MAARLARLTTTWNISNGLEKAQSTCWWLSPSGSALSTLVSALDANTTTWWTSLRPQLPTRVALAKQHVDEVNINTGKVIQGTDLLSQVSPLGSNASNQLPPETSAVIAIRTPFSGGSYRGRMFMPPTGITSIDADGFLLSSVATPMVNAWATFFSAIAGGGTDWVPGVYSRKMVAFTPCDRLDIGNVLDVQRSRRRSLIETRISAVVS